MSKKRVLSGIQPSGVLHLGNYFGMMKQMIELQESSDLFVFIANYHALTSLKDADALKENTVDAAISFLSLGIDPNKTTFWVQSDVKEVLELYRILSSYTPMEMKLSISCHRILLMYFSAITMAGWFIHQL